VLLAAYGLAVTLPLVILLAVLLYRSTHIERVQLEQRMLQVASGLAEDIDRDLDHGMALLHVLATSPALQREDWPAFYEQAKAALKEPAYVILVDRTGRQIINTYVRFGEEPTLTGDPATVQRILASKGPVVSDLYTSLVVKKPVYNVSIPVSKEEDVRYILSLGQLPENLVQILRSQRLDASWVCTIWDRKGVLIARSRDHERFLATQAPREFDRSRTGVFATTNLDGERVLLAATQSKHAEWRIAVSLPIATAEAPLRWYLQAWGGAAVVATIITILLALGFGAFLEKPLVAAAEAARAFGREDAIRGFQSRVREVEEVTDALRGCALFGIERAS